MMLSRLYPFLFLIICTLGVLPACGKKTEVQLVNDEGSSVDCSLSFTDNYWDVDRGGSRKTINENKTTNESFSRALSSTSAAVSVTCQKLDEGDMKAVEVKILVGEKEIKRDSTNKSRGVVTASYTPAPLPPRSNTGSTTGNTGTASSSSTR